LVNKQANKHIREDNEEEEEAILPFLADDNGDEVDSQTLPSTLMQLITFIIEVKREKRLDQALLNEEKTNQLKG